MYIERIIEETLNSKRKNRKILIILGARQVGKTTLVEHFSRGDEVARLNLDVQIEKQRLIAASNWIRKRL